jgi:hypothetical protein
MASEALGNGEDLYGRLYAEGFHYFYSPFFALLIYPLTLIPVEIAGTIWSLLSFLMLARTFILIQKLLLPDAKKKNLIYCLTFAALVFPLYSNFHMTQMSAFILYAIFESCYFVFHKKQPLAGAALLALAINIKILPVVFIFYFLYRKAFKAAGFTVLFTIVLLLLPMLFLGYDYNSELHNSWWGLIDPTNERNVLDIQERGFHGLSTFFSTLFSDQFGPNEMQHKRNILNLDITTIGWIINSARLLLIGFTLYFLRTRPFKKSIGRLHMMWEISYICLIIPLIFPHQQTYGFYLLFPAGCYLIYYFFYAKPHFKTPWKFQTLIGLACLAFVIINLEILIGAYRELFWHYKTLTYGTLLLLIVLALCPPFDQKESALEASNENS